MADVIHYCQLGKMDVPREINNLTLFFFLEAAQETSQFPHIRFAEIHNGKLNGIKIGSRKMESRNSEHRAWSRDAAD